MGWVTVEISVSPFPEFSGSFRSSQAGAPNMAKQLCVLSYGLYPETGLLAIIRSIPHLGIGKGLEEGETELK